jgi:hypothetical protein
MANISLKPSWLINMNNNIKISNIIQNDDYQPISNKKKLIKYVLLDEKRYVFSFNDFTDYMNNDNFNIENCNINNKDYNSDKFIEYNIYDASEEIEDEYLDDLDYLDYLVNIENQQELDNYEYYEEIMYYRYLNNIDNAESYSDEEYY